MKKYNVQFGPEEAELERNGADQSERVKKMRNLIKEKMRSHREDLVIKWRDHYEHLEYRALKEMRSEFESTHKKMRHMVNEWDRRRLSDVLSDFLVNIIDQKYDEYMEEFRFMAELIRTEAARQTRNSRSRSGGRSVKQFRSKEDFGERNNRFTRDNPRERSSNRDRDKRERRVSFQEKEGRRDSTPKEAGTTSIIMCNKSYDRIFENDEFFN